MTQDERNKYLVAVIGAGPAGIYASRHLASQGVQVVLFNRDIKPGGLAEYGIYHSKFRMKDGLRKQFRQILEMPGIEYLGNAVVSQESGLSLDDLRQAGVQAILTTVGAQGTKWLGMPGEKLDGVYHAKDLVYHYNKLPPFSTWHFEIGKRVALIGAGNVMLDIAHWFTRELKVEEAIAVVRRGPAEVKFSKKEMENIARNLDLDAFDDERERVAPIMAAIGQDVQAAKDFILSALPKALEPVSKTRFLFDFLASPTRMLGNDQGRVCGLEVEDTTLVAKNGDTKARGLGTTRTINVDTVVFCIGDRVDDTFGLPVQWNEFVKNPNPLYPVDGLSYEAYDPEASTPIEGIFVAGWSREASSGLVGVARKDGENGAKAILQYLSTKPPIADEGEVMERIKQLVARTGHVPIIKDDLKRLEAIEQAEAERRGLQEYKIKTNEEMLALLGLA